MPSSLANVTRPLARRAAQPNKVASADRSERGTGALGEAWAGTLTSEELPRALDMEMAGKLTAIFKPLGFHYVTLDLEGYRQGSLNAALGMKPAGAE